MISQKEEILLDMSGHTVKKNNNGLLEHYKARLVTNLLSNCEAYYCKDFTCTCTNTRFSVRTN